MSLASLLINQHPFLFNHELLTWRYSSRDMALKPNILLARGCGGSSNNSHIGSAFRGRKMIRVWATSSNSSTNTDNNVGLDRSSLLLKKRIAEFYDESSDIWEDIWGDHMHHGFYDDDSPISLSDHRLAQIRMIVEALRFASVPSEEENNLSKAKGPKRIVDVGCGIGGSSRYLAQKYGAQCWGITLSPIQAERANALALSQGLSDQVSFLVADALEQPFPDAQFDLVWSMESGEHMPDKRKFVNELVRVAAPGGAIIIVTWCHRDLVEAEDSLQPWEKELLDKICDAYFLPSWCSAADYIKLLQSLSVEDIRTADWTRFVAPFWPAVLQSALTWKGLTSLLRSGFKTIKGAFAMPLMIEGYKKGVIKFAIITCRKRK